MHRSNIANERTSTNNQPQRWTLLPPANTNTTSDPHNPRPSIQETLPDIPLDILPLAILPPLHINIFNRDFADGYTLSREHALVDDGVAGEEEEVCGEDVERWGEEVDDVPGNEVF